MENKTMKRYDVFFMKGKEVGEVKLNIYDTHNKVLIVDNYVILDYDVPDLLKELAAEFGSLRDGDVNKRFWGHAYTATTKNTL